VGRVLGSGREGEHEGDGTGGEAHAPCTEGEAGGFRPFRYSWAP
jgi:hypothetical protein